MRMNSLPPRGLYAITPIDLAGRALVDATREIIAGGPNNTLYSWI